MPWMNRRRLIKAAAGVAAGGLGAAAIGLNPGSASAVEVKPAFLLNPFRFGVSSSPVDNVLWTKLAISLFESDGRGGMPTGDVRVNWVVARNRALSDVVASGTALAYDVHGHTVHLSVPDLPVNTELFYQFSYSNWRSDVGRMRTFPASTDGTTPLKIAAASCANFEHGYFHLYDHIATYNVDLVLMLGDYVYADSYDPAIRDHLPSRGDCFTLADYRIRHNQYHSDPSERRMRASAPMIALFDDHEIDNDWAGDVPETPASAGSAGWWVRRHNGMKAFWENTPMAMSRQPKNSRIDITGHHAWGKLASFHLLDTRQFRSDQDSGREEDTNRYLLGPQQREMLRQNYRGARWDFLAQQVVMAGWDPTGAFNVDAWDNYDAERQRVLGDLVRMGVRNPVVLTGDVHNAFAQYVSDKNGNRRAVELVTSSITSEGDGERTYGGLGPGTGEIKATNDDVLWTSGHRGWMLLDVDYNRINVQWRGTQFVTETGAQPDRLIASCTVQDRSMTFSNKTTHIPLMATDWD
ncbi:alkaline phosphatase D family protein [Streptomyces sp. NPDC057271]|uniref:alkaline phosphatase D family protein n=1 Tax=unclassified Streptomyces TaxID=2593676 RepID=UPI00362E0532